MIYFDNSATSHPKIPEVVDAVLRAMTEYNGNPGRSGHRNAKKSAEIIIEARENIAKLFGISDIMQIIFTKNGTEGLNIAINGLLKQGDHVITSIYEHNSVLRPLNHLKEDYVITLDYVEPNKEGFITESSIEKLIKNNTRLIVINHVSNVVGIIQDIKSIGALAKENGLIFMVDASQSAGVIDIDVKRDNIDLLAAPGHKELLGPQGTGFLYVNPKIEIDPIYFGGTGSHSFSVCQPKMMPDRLESGTLNTPGITGLNEGLKYILNKGTDKIREKELKLCKYLLKELSNLEEITIYGSIIPERRMPVISFNYKDFDPAEVSYILDKEFGIASRPGIHCAPLVHEYFSTKDLGGMVRVSLNHFNTYKEIDQFIIAIKKIEKYI